MKGFSLIDRSLYRYQSQSRQLKRLTFNILGASTSGSAMSFSVSSGAGGGEKANSVSPTTNTDWRQGSIFKNGKYLVTWLTEDGIWKMPSFSDIWKWQISRVAPTPPSPGDFPIWKPDWAKINAERAKNGSQQLDNSCTWLGHATCLLSIGDVNVIADPVFSERCSPVQFAGPKRYTPPACAIEDLPPIHMVLISHNHYDHLDTSSIYELEAKFKPIYVCGLGLGVWFSDCGIDKSRIVEMDWWETKEIAVNSTSKSIVSTQFVPVQHWSKRFINDDQTSLWGGFVVAKDDFKFFFNGDTGYNPVLYEEIGKRVGQIDIAAIPIGAYEPRSIMKVQHVDPEEAFLIHKHLSCKYSFGIHFGTFVLTDEPLREPIERINKVTKENPDSPPFEAIEHGVTVIMNRSDKSVRQFK